MPRSVSVRACNDTNPTFGARKDEQSHVKNATEATYSSVKLMQPRRGRNASRSSWKKSAWRASSLSCVSIFRLQRNNLPLVLPPPLLSLVSFSSRKKTRVSIVILFNVFFLNKFISLGSLVLYFLHAHICFSCIYSPFQASKRKVIPRVSNVNYGIRFILSLLLFVCMLKRWATIFFPDAHFV